MEFACLSQIMGPILEFEQEGEVSGEDLRSAALLLPVIMEEEGPDVVFPASLFILGKMRDDIGYVESLIRVVDPLLVEPLPTKENELNCVGMIFEREDYYELKRRLLGVIDEYLMDLIEDVQPSLVLMFSF